MEDLQVLAAEINNALRKPAQPQAPDPVERVSISGIEGTVTINGTDQHGNLVTLRVPPGFFGFDTYEKEFRERALATQYFQICDLHDGTVCSGISSTGEPMPATPQEYHLVQCNAREVIRFLAGSEALTEDEVRKIIQKWKREIIRT